MKDVEYSFSARATPASAKRGAACVLFKSLYGAENLLQLFLAKRHQLFQVLPYAGCRDQVAEHAAGRVELDFFDDLRAGIGRFELVDVNPARKRALLLFDGDQLVLAVGRDLVGDLLRNAPAPAFPDQPRAFG